VNEQNLPQLHRTVPFLSSNRTLWQNASSLLVDETCDCHVAVPSDLSVIVAPACSKQSPDVAAPDQVSVNDDAGAIGFGAFVFIEESSLPVGA
jgi:hypothetical protein